MCYLKFPNILVIEELLMLSLSSIWETTYKSSLVDE